MPDRTETVRCCDLLVSDPAAIASMARYLLSQVSLATGTLDLVDIDDARGLLTRALRHVASDFAERK